MGAIQSNKKETVPLMGVLESQELLSARIYSLESDINMMKAEIRELQHSIDIVAKLLSTPSSKAGK